MLLACVTLYFQMDLPRRGLKALLVYKIVFILETNCTDTFNLRQCVQHLAQFNDEEVLLAVVVYCVEKVRLDLALKVPFEHKTILFLKKNYRLGPCGDTQYPLPNIPNLTRPKVALTTVPPFK